MPATGRPIAARGMSDNVRSERRHAPIRFFRIGRRSVCSNHQYCARTLQRLARAVAPVLSTGLLNWGAWLALNAASTQSNCSQNPVSLSPSFWRRWWVGPPRRGLLRCRRGGAFPWAWPHHHGKCAGPHTVDGPSRWLITSPASATGPPTTGCTPSDVAGCSVIVYLTRGSRGQARSRRARCR